MVRVFTCCPEDQGSMFAQVIAKTQKWVRTSLTLSKGSRASGVTLEKK